MAFLRRFALVSGVRDMLSFAHFGGGGGNLIRRASPSGTFRFVVPPECVVSWDGCFVAFADVFAVFTLYTALKIEGIGELCRLEVGCVRYFHWADFPSAIFSDFRRDWSNPKKKLKMDSTRGRSHFKKTHEKNTSHTEYTRRRNRKIPAIRWPPDCPSVDTSFECDGTVLRGEKPILHFHLLCYCCCCKLF